MGGAAPKGRRGRAPLVLAPFLIGGVVLVLRGHGLAVIGVVVVAFGVLQARMVSPRFARTYDGALATASRAVALAVRALLSWVLLTLVYGVVIVPVSAFALVLRRNPLDHKGAATPPGWAPPATVDSARSSRAFRVEARSPARPTQEARVRRGRWPRVRACKALAILAAILALDLLAGNVLAVTGILPGERGDLLRVEEQGVGQIMDSPAIRSEPWADSYGDELLEYQKDTSDYLPYLIQGFHPFRGHYINTTDLERRSYEPPRSPSAERPAIRVAFFGGSTMFGMGQRDDHTIPSEFARIAEGHDLPIEVHNHGLPRWVAWQEFQYLEQLLAAGHRYDLVIFYDGFNEFAIQGQEYSPNPTHNGLPGLQQLARSYHREHETLPGLLDTPRELVTAYRRNSAISHLVDRLAGHTPSAANPPVARHASSERKADAALDIYSRTVALIRDLAEDHDSPVRFFWQPQRAGWPTEVIERLPPGVTDISHALDGHQEESYIDLVHTNEEGARLVATAMWETLSPELISMVRSGARAGS